MKKPMSSLTLGMVWANAIFCLALVFLTVGLDMSGVQKIQSHVIGFELTWCLLTTGILVWARDRPVRVPVKY